MTEKPAPLVVRTLNKPDAPEIYVTEAPAFWAFGGALHMTFVTARPDHTSQPVSFDRVVLARVVMPAPAATLFAQSLWAFLQSQGIDPAGKPDESPLQ